jgi:hypothetical protein
MPSHTHIHSAVLPCPSPACHTFREADVFSFGVILWELITLEKPWVDEMDRPSGTFFIINSVVEGIRLPFPARQNIGPPLPEVGDVITLAQHCWEAVPAARPTMQQVGKRLGGIISHIRGRRMEESRAAAGQHAKQ